MKVYSCLKYKKRRKLINGFTRYINMYTNQIIQSILLIYIQLKYNTPMLKKNNDTLENFGLIKIRNLHLKSRI